MRAWMLWCVVAAWPVMAQVPTGPVAGDTLSWIWHRGNWLVDRATGVATAEDGVYSVGEAMGAFDGNSPLGGSDVVVARHLPSGVKVWSRTHGTSLNDVGKGVAIHAASATPELYVTGYTMDDWGGPSHGSTDGFLLRLNPANGDLLWVRQFGSQGRDEPMGVATSPSGAVYVAGQTTDALFGGPYSGVFDGFLGKYDSSGNLLWMRQFGTPGSDLVHGVATDANNDAYVVGSTSGALVGVNAGATDLFIAKYNSEGVLLWTRQMGTDGTEALQGVATVQQGDGSIDVYVTGFTDRAFDGQSQVGGQDMLLMKFDGLGTRVWTRQFGTQGNEVANGVAADGGAHVYVAGQSRHDFISGAPDTSSNFVLAKYSAGGVELLRRQLGSVGANPQVPGGDEISRGVAVDINDSVYVAGITSGSFTNPTTTSQGNEDYVLLRYAEGCQVNTSGPCGIGYGWGDPHLVTFDNRAYDFQGAGEFVFVESSDAAAPFTVQVRMQPWGGDRRASVMTAVATRLGPSRVGLYLARLRAPLLRVDGAVVDLPVGRTLPVAGGGRILRRSTSDYLFSYPGQDRMLVSMVRGYLGIVLSLSPSRQAAIRGLLGNYDGIGTNEYSLRNGGSLSPTLSFTELHAGPNSFASSWRISKMESLFDYEPGQGTATFSVPGFPSAPVTVADLPAAERDAARSRCLSGGFMEDVFLDGCTVDVAVTQDMTFVAAASWMVGQVQRQRGPAAPAPQPAGRRLYFANFLAPVGAEWSASPVSTTPNGTQTFLGPFTQQALSLTLPATGNPGIIALSFDVLLMGGWDGDGALGPSTWSMSQGASTLGGTFSNTSSPQSYPSSGSAPRTGSQANDTLGYPGGDSLYRFKHRFVTDGASPLVVTFQGANLSSPLNPSWGLDNVEVHLE